MKKLIISLISFAAALVLVFVFIIPLWDSLGFVKNTLASKEKELAQLQARVEKVNRLEKEYQNLEGEVEKVFLALPAEEDIPNLLVQFEALASSNGLILDTISFGELSSTGPEKAVQRVSAFDMIEEETSSAKPSQESGLRTLSVSMNLAGRYPNFKNYLNSLTRNIRSMSVESISFSTSQSSEKSDASSFVFDLTVNVYYQ